MSFYIDFKIISWNRIHVPDKSIKKIKKALLKGDIKNESDVYDIDDDCEYEHLFEADEPMTVETNEGNSTIEAYDEEGKLIYKNTK